MLGVSLPLGLAECADKGVLGGFGWTELLMPASAAAQYYSFCCKPLFQCWGTDSAAIAACHCSTYTRWRMLCPFGACQVLKRSLKKTGVLSRQTLAHI